MSGDWPTPFAFTTSEESISVASALGSAGDALGATNGNPAGAAWPAASRALFIPFTIDQGTIFTVTQVVVGIGTTGGGNLDTGIFDRYGNKVVTAGATARGSASSEQTINITDADFLPGLYYMALVGDGTNNYVAWVPGNVGLLRALGIKQMASAYPLPNVVTFATPASAYIPAFSLWGTAK